MSPDEQRPCQHCEGGGNVRPVGQGRSTVEIDYVPGYFRRRVHVQGVLACTCERHIVTAPAPVRVYDKCQYGPSFLAHLVVSKCADSMPLYRLEKAYARVGVADLAQHDERAVPPSGRTTQAHLRTPARAIRSEHVVHADETPMRMQVRRKKAYVWTFRAGKNIGYVFTKSRSGATPRDVLGDSQGVLDRLRAAYLALKRKAAAGVDGVTWDEYGQGLEARLADLHARVHRGGYRARPSRRVYISKPDGRQRPLGIAALEDKILQRAIVEVLNAIYEVDFLGFSYGFRPGRSQHHALDALAVAIHHKRVNWVLDADIRGFFDAIDHGWMVKFIEHRIADKRIVRLIQKWLAAGVLEDGKWSATEEGTPQGATISPLLANIYLHYVLDRWVQQWRKRAARGEVIVVRYADDFVMGFQHEADAARFRADLQQRLERFALEVNPDKTRLMRFGRYAEGTAA